MTLNLVKRINLKLIVLIVILILLAYLSLLLVFLYFAKTFNAQVNFYYFLRKINLCSDANSYANIAHYGYLDLTVNPRVYLCNFFPLYPIYLKILSSIIPVNVFSEWYFNLYLLAFFFNPILLIVSCIFTHKYILLTRNNKKEAILAVILLIIGPFSFFVFENISEALFMMLLIMAMYSLKKKYYIRMGICGALLTATRFIGIFFVIFILINVISEYLKEKEKKSFIGFIKYCLSRPTLLIGLSLVPIGLISYMIFLQVNLHDGFAFLHTQIYNYGHFYKGYFKVIFDANSTQLVIVGFSLLMVIFLMVKKRFEEATLPLMNYLIVGPSTLLSLPRYFFESFTVMFAFLDLLFEINFKNQKANKIILYSSMTFMCLYELVLYYYVFTFNYQVIT